MTLREKRVSRWVGECLRKKPLREKWANDIISRAKAEGTDLFKYHCPHCCHFHVTKWPRHKQRIA